MKVGLEARSSGAAIDDDLAIDYQPCRNLERLANTYSDIMISLSAQILHAAGRDGLNYYLKTQIELLYRLRRANALPDDPHC